MHGCFELVILTCSFPLLFGFTFTSNLGSCLFRQMHCSLSPFFGSLCSLLYQIKKGHPVYWPFLSIISSLSICFKQNTAPNTLSCPGPLTSRLTQRLTHACTDTQKELKIQGQSTMLWKNKHKITLKHSNIFKKRSSNLPRNTHSPKRHIQVYAV